jgi:hypothetical protein
MKNVLRGTTGFVRRLAGAVKRSRRWRPGAQAAPAATAETQRDALSAEVREDLSKSYKQLLTDVYEELLKQPDHEDALRHGLKRACSLFAKMGLDSAQTQADVRFLTWWIACLTVVMVVVMFHEAGVLTWVSLLAFSVVFVLLFVLKHTGGG